MAAKKPATVDAFLASLDDGQRAIVERLRTLVARAAPDVSEHIKWNAPSFCVDGDDRVTLGVERDGAIRVVLHRGAKPKAAKGFAFADDANVATWPAPDRGVVVFKDLAALRAREPALSALVTRWLAATRG